MNTKLTRPLVPVTLVAAWLAAAPPQSVAQELACEFECGNQRVHSVDFSPDGRLLAAGNFRGRVRVWNVAQQKEVATFDAYELEVRCLEFIDGGKSLLSVSADGNVKVWETSTWKATNGFPMTANSAAAVSPDGKQLLAGGFGRAISFEIASGEQTKQFSHETLVFGVAFSPDGKQIVTASDSSIRVWDFINGRQLATLPYSGGGTLRGLALTSDGKYAAAGEEQKFVYVWDVSRRKALRTFDLGGAVIVRDLQFSPDNRTLAVGNEVGDLHLFDIASGKQRKKWKAAVSETLAYSPDGALLAAGGMTVESQGRVQLWTVAKPIVKPRSRQ